MPTKETIIYNGVKYNRYPDAKNFSDRAYFRAHIAGRKLGFTCLHRDKWIAEVGPIPEGYHIHHKDGNTLNNDISNLECLSPSEHSERHPMDERKKHGMRKRISELQEKAINWHKSEQGREWHKEHGKSVWAEREPKTYTCENCNKEFQSLKYSKVRFCSNVCKSQFRRANDLNSEKRNCA